MGRVPDTPDQFGDLARHPENVVPEGVVIVRVESPLFFANADLVRGRIREPARRQGARAVILDAETIPGLDVTAARMLSELAEDLERAGVELHVARDVGQVRDVLRTAAPDALPRLHATVAKAVESVTPAG